ncbi:hypothetical protein V8E53_004828 [Lactarius tabidus]
MHVPTDSLPEESEARKACFSALSKERWDRLQSEYAGYRERLSHRIAASTVPNEINNTHGSERTLAPAPAAQPPASKLQSYFFARHVPPDTNKTALRTRFSTAPDYVDYTKGLDSCHLHLTMPEHARELMKPSRNTSAQELELELEPLEGQGEEVYWGNVPEKVCALAVQRVHVQVHQTQRDHAHGVGQGADADDVEEDTVCTSRAIETRRRKHRQ